MVTHRRARSGSRPHAAPCWYSSCPETRWAGGSRASQEPSPGLSCRGWACTLTPSVLLHLTGMQESHHSGSACTPRQGISRGASRQGKCIKGHARRVASRRQQVPKSRPGPVLPHFRRQGPSRSRPHSRLTPLTCRPGVRVGATCSVRDQSAPAGGGDQSQTPREARNYSNPRRLGNGLGQPAAAEGAQAANRRSERAGQSVGGVAWRLQSTARGLGVV